MSNTHDIKILLVDDTPSNIKILVETLRGDYKLAVATNGRDAISDALSPVPPDLILLDVMMPDMDGYDVCSVLKKNQATRNIPIIFVTALCDEKNEYKGFELGAVDYIVKPINPSIVRARVKTHIILKQHQDRLEDLVTMKTFQLHKTTFEIVNRLARAAEYRDNETGMHITRMSHYCSIIGEALSMSSEDCELLHHAASMHDVGKIGIPDHILLKPGKLEKHEFDIMKSHTTIGAELLAGHDSELLKMAATIAHTHHERYDGNGYPEKISKTDIPIFGRITSVCDVFDALTSERPYKKAWDVDRALSELINGKATQFDPDLVDLFIENIPAILKIKDQFADSDSTGHRRLPKRMTA